MQNFSTSIAIHHSCVKRVKQAGALTKRATFLCNKEGLVQHYRHREIGMYIFLIYQLHLALLCFI
jgi:hypothetical protein